MTITAVTITLSVSVTTVTTIAVIAITITITILTLTVVTIILLILAIKKIHLKFLLIGHRIGLRNITITRSHRYRLIVRNKNTRMTRRQVIIIRHLTIRHRSKIADLRSNLNYQTVISRKLRLHTATNRTIHLGHKTLSNSTRRRVLRNTIIGSFINRALCRIQ